MKKDNDEVLAGTQRSYTVVFLAIKEQGGTYHARWRKNRGDLLLPCLLWRH